MPLAHLLCRPAPSDAPQGSVGPAACIGEPVRKLSAIAWREVVSQLSHPWVLLMSVAVPLAIAVLLKMAFGNLVLGRGVPDADIAVGIVNQDRGGRWGDIGEVFSRAFSLGVDDYAPARDLPFKLFSMKEIEDEGQARRLVDQEKLVAALFVPPDFSDALAAGRATLTVYSNDRYLHRGVAFSTVVKTLANLVSLGEVTVRTAANGLMGDSNTTIRMRSGELNEAIAELALTATETESNPIKVERVNSSVASSQLDLARHIAAAIAVMFAGYWCLTGTASILQEQSQWTFQRMHVTPTRPSVILAGKALGVYVGAVARTLAFIGCMGAMEWIQSSAPLQGPRTNLLGLCLLVLSVPMATTGFGVAIAGLAGTITHAANYGRGILILMGLVGGIFFPADLFPKVLRPLSYASYHYWAMDGYQRMALGARTISVLPHALILACSGALLWSLGGWLLRRRNGFT